MNRILALITVIFCCAGQLLFAQSAANTLIINQATVDYQINGNTQQVTSNIAQFRVLEVIDHSIVTNNPSGVLSASPSNNQALGFTLTNNGNGEESYALSTNQLITDDFDATNTRIFIDTNNNGIFEISNDTLYIPGTNDPSLNIGESVGLFIISDIPTAITIGNEARIELQAISNTGIGSPGDLIAGGGPNGVDAVLGTSGGQAQDNSLYRVSDTAVLITKKSTIIDEQGGNLAIPGSVITYTLELNLSGSGIVQASTLRDSIPVGTEYIPNSLFIGGGFQTDALDSDRGSFDGAQVLFNLGNLAAPQVIEVNFKVRIL